jgi:phage/plasmid-associated DNA primase
VPMGASVPELDRVAGIDEQIAAAEGPGVLALLAWGAREALSGRMEMPAPVAAATAEYVAEQDTVANFLAECCSAAGSNGQGPAGAGQHQVWEAYLWYTQHGPRLPKQEFKRRLGAVPGVHVNEPRRTYEGVTLQPWVIEQI